jgi:hypothetical protein
VPAEEVLQLGFSASTFRFAARPGVARSEDDFAGLRIAASYPGLVGKHLFDRGVHTEVIRLDGAVETSIRLGVAEVIADVVETRATLRHAGLEIIGEPILSSEAALVRRVGAEQSPRVDQLLRRLQGVLVARRHVMMDYDIKVERVDDACAITPGLESPTVSPLHTEGWSPSARWSHAATPTASWTPCGTSARERSWSPTSTPAAYRERHHRPRDVLEQGPGPVEGIRASSACCVCPDSACCANPDTGLLPLPAAGDKQPRQPAARHELADQPRLPTIGSTVARPAPTQAARPPRTNSSPPWQPRTA